ncbi:hypothetical protein Clacol_001135 [Clathrus columnatus]|uniref:BTB domain-containing protein n=1 Tax=Clathrus columnatus TaxID=1419009 RepID=A0AAV5A2G9_9AGAM|nr:hypothetical protein Clacol_001135 [Clathrus columnatus]
MSNTNQTTDAMLVTVTIKNSESIYLPDGDIVLFSLPKNNVITAFKVDRVFLRRSSPVFEGMFMLPPSGDVESYDNVPLVKLQDEADHLTMFLNALYGSRCIPWEKYNVNALRTMEGILLLANKYQIDHLRELIIGLLERDWPSKLDHWDYNEVESRAKKRFFELIDEISMPDPCQVIRLARKCNVPSILPAAFYRLSCIQGISYRHLPEPLQEKFSDRIQKETADFSLLSVEDFCCLLVGRNAMLHVFEDSLNEAFWKALEYEHPPLASHQCGQGLEHLKYSLRQAVFLFHNDLLSIMNAESAVGIEPPQTCQDCREQLLGLLEESREAFWRRLPSLFMLDPKP